MDSAYYSLSSKSLPNNLSLVIHHGYDFELPYSQANYNFLQYSFMHDSGFEVGVKVYLDELSMPPDVRSPLKVGPSYEPYSRASLPDNYIASVLKTLAIFGYSAIYEDYDGQAMRLDAIYKPKELDAVMQDWLNQMNEARN